MNIRDLEETDSFYKNISKALESAGKDFDENGDDDSADIDKNFERPDPKPETSKEAEWYEQDAGQLWHELDNNPEQELDKQEKTRQVDSAMDPIDKEYFDIKSQYWEGFSKQKLDEFLDRVKQLKGTAQSTVGIIPVKRSGFYTKRNYDETEFLNQVVSDMDGLINRVKELKDSKSPLLLGGWEKLAKESANECPTGSGVCCDGYIKDFEGNCKTYAQTLSEPHSWDLSIYEAHKIREQNFEAWKQEQIFNPNTQYSNDKTPEGIYDINKDRKATNEYDKGENMDAEAWWNQLDNDAQTQALIASQVDERHAGLSWTNLGHENQQKIIMEYGNSFGHIIGEANVNQQDLETWFNSQDENGKEQAILAGGGGWGKYDGNVQWSDLSPAIQSGIQAEYGTGATDGTYESRANEAEITAEDIVDKLNSNLSSDYYPRETNHIREIENLGNGNVKFKYSGGQIDDEIERMFEASGFTISNINNILDSGHLDAEGKLGESKTIYKSQSGLVNGTESYETVEVDLGKSDSGMRYTCNCGQQVSESELPEHMKQWHGAKLGEARYNTYKTNQNPNIQQDDANVRDVDLGKKTFSGEALGSVLGKKFATEDLGQDMDTIDPYSTGVSVDYMEEARRLGEQGLDTEGIADELMLEYGLDYQTAFDYASKGAGSGDADLGRFEDPDYKTTDPNYVWEQYAMKDEYGYEKEDRHEEDPVGELRSIAGEEEEDDKKVSLNVNNGTMKDIPIERTDEHHTTADKDSTSPDDEGFDIHNILSGNYSKVTNYEELAEPNHELGSHHVRSKKGERNSSDNPASETKRFYSNIINKLSGLEADEE